MAKIALLVFAAAACVAYVTSASNDKGPCTGCAVDQPKEQYPEALKKLKVALATTNSDSSVEKIISYKTQVVAGTKYIVEYMDKSKKTCTATWVEQPWISKEPQYVTVKC